MTDLILHLGVVHRWVSRIIAERMQQPPEIGDLPRLALMEEWKGGVRRGKRRLGTASGSCSSALTGQRDGQCGSTATPSCLVRPTVITTFR